MYPIAECLDKNYTLIHKTVGTSEWVDILENIIAPILDAGGWAGFDVEGSGLNPHAEWYDLTGTGIAVLDTPTSGRSWYCDHKWPSSILYGEELERYRRFLEKYQGRLVVYNSSYEVKALWATTGSPYYFTDCRAIVCAAGRSGSLKQNAKEYINAHEWEDENHYFVDAFWEISKIWNKHYSEECKIARDTRIQLEVDGKDFNWTKVIPRLDEIKAEIDYPKIQDAVLKRDISELSNIQNNFVKAVECGVTEDEVFQSMMYDIETGWGGAPTRSLSPYCGWDCFFTVKLFTHLYQDERLRNAYPRMQDEIMVGGVMESFGINWDDNVAEELNNTYYKLQVNSMKVLLKDMAFEWDDQGWMRELLDKILVDDIQYPIVYEVRNKKGGYTYVPDSDGNIPTAKQMENWLPTLFDETDPNLSLPVLVEPTYFINALTEECNQLEDEKKDYEHKLNLMTTGLIEMDSEGYTQADYAKWIASAERKKYNREQKIIAIKNSPNAQWYGRELTKETYQVLEAPVCVKYTWRKGQPEYIDKREYSVENDADLIDHIKSIFFNPGSNTPYNRGLFWNMYLTPRMITANILYNVIHYIDTAGLLDQFEHTVTKDTTTGEEIHHDPVRKILHPDGRIEVLTGNVIDRMSLQNTIVNMVQLQKMIPNSNSIPYALIGTGPVTYGFTEEQKAQHQERIEVFNTQNQYKNVIGDCLANMKNWTGEGSGFDTDTIEWQHKIHKGVLGFDIDKPETWSPEYILLHNFRIFKKCAKNLSTYINGDKLGRGSVYELTDKYSVDRSVRLRDIKNPISKLEVPVSQSLVPSRFKKWYHDCQVNSLPELSRESRLVLASDFFTLGTETRRWTSRNHTVPANSELRRCYQPHYPGWLRVHEDYSGAELCVVAGMTNCKAMLHAFMTGGDVHMNTAVGVFQLPASEITDMMRRYCKIITFRLLYGSTVPGLAQELGISLQRAQEMVDGFMSTYPELEEYIRWSRWHARKYGWVPSITGAPLNLDPNSREIDQTSINYRIQTSATNIAGSGIARSWKNYYRIGLPWIPECFTHDSIDASIHPMYYPMHVFFAKRIAEDDNFHDLGTPMRMDFEVGVNGYYICGIKNRTRSIYSGMSQDDPIVLKIHGWENSINDVLGALRPFFDIDVEFNKVEDTSIPLADLWIPKRAYSSTFGQPIKEYSGEVRMTYKKDHPEFASILRLMGNDYTAETHNILLNSFRSWPTWSGSKYGE